MQKDPSPHHRFSKNDRASSLQVFGFPSIPNSVLIFPQCRFSAGYISLHPAWGDLHARTAVTPALSEFDPLPTLAQPRKGRRKAGKRRKVSHADSSLEPCQSGISRPGQERKDVRLSKKTRAARREPGEFLNLGLVLHDPELG